MGELESKGGSARDGGPTLNRSKFPPPFLPPPFSTNFDPNPAGDTVTLSSGAVIVTAANATDLRVQVTQTPQTGSLDATVTAYGGASSPTLFAYFASGAGNNVSSCLINDARTAVNATTCAAASTTISAPVAVALANGYAYVASSAGGVVEACTVSNGTFVGCSSTTVAAAAGATLSALTLDPSGTNLYATDAANSNVVRCAVSGTALTSCAVALSSGTLPALAAPSAIAVSADKAYITSTAVTNGLIICQASVNVAGSLTACGRYNSSSIATPTGLNYFTYSGGGTTNHHLWIVNSAVNSFVNCDLDASSTLFNCNGLAQNAYAGGLTPTGLAAIPTLAGGAAPTLFVAASTGVNQNCDTNSITCLGMPFGYSYGVAVG